MIEVAVVIPAFNRASLQLRTVEYVLAQSAKASELIVVDAGSDDELVPVRRLVVKEEERVRLLNEAWSMVP